MFLVQEGRMSLSLTLVWFLGDGGFQNPQITHLMLKRKGTLCSVGTSGVSQKQSVCAG